MFICPRGFLLHSQALSGLMLLQILWSAAAQFFAAPSSPTSESKRRTTQKRQQQRETSPTRKVS